MAFVHKKEHKKLEAAIIEIAVENKSQRMADVGISFARACQKWQYMKNNTNNFTVQDAQRHIMYCKNLVNQLNQVDYKKEIYALVLGIYDMTVKGE